MVAIVAPVLGGECLELSVDRIGKRSRQRSLGVADEQPVPIRTPNQLDDVPACTAEQRLKLINDTAVTAHRTVETLEIAVDHPHQVIQPLARCQRQCRHALGFVHLAVAKYPPHLTSTRLQQVAMLEITHKTSLVNGADGTDAHGSGRE